MRLRALGAAVAVAGLLAGAAGCSGDSDRPSTRSSSEEQIAPTLPAATKAADTGDTGDGGTTAALPPASAAGGVCAGITFAEVATATGTQFEVAAASGGGSDARSCALQRIGATTPDLLFTVLPASDLTAADYKSDLVPAGSAPTRGLGQAGYNRVLAPAAGAGPQAEIGWLGSGRAYTLTFTTPRGTSAAAARAYLPKLVQLGPRLLS